LPANNNVIKVGMVLDVDFFRKDKGGDPDLIRLSQKQRYKNQNLVDEVLHNDSEWRAVRFKVDQWNKFKNLCGKAISDKIKADKKQRNQQVTAQEQQGQKDIKISIESLDKDKIMALSINEIKKLSTQIDNEVAEMQLRVKELLKSRDAALREVGNILHRDVPISNDEEDNAIIRTFGDFKVTKPLNHIDICSKIDGVDTTRGIKVAGARNYFLKGPLVFLEQALIQLSMRILLDEEYIALYTPFLMKRDVMEEVAQLSQFHEELYKVTEKSDVDSTEEEKYLIATSEQPIAAYHRDEWIDPSRLPIKYSGLSTCFRQEVGSHGKDTRGIFRVHQFEKVEQFCITSPENDESWKMFHHMIANSEKFYQLLKIPYRIVSIVSGELNNAAAMKYDLEAWFPGSQSFRELVSCSNCTDYQSRSLKIRFGQTKKQQGSANYVHMLNCTMCATTRTICAILENYQTPDGVVIPDILQSFMPTQFQTFIPYLKISDSNGTIE
ncbi:hypothetical protein GJ496_000231, partial [Pomphorhynchus laevis]